MQPRVEWMTAIQNIVKMTGNLQAQRHANVLENNVCAIPTNESGADKLAVKYISMAKYKDKPWVGLVFIGAKTVIPAGAWSEHIRNSKNIAEYHGSINTIIFRDDLLQIRILRGLIAHHEMQHWWQKMNPLPPQTPDLKTLAELDAYEFEFDLLDKLKLPGLPELVAFERAHIRKYLKSNQSFFTNFDNPMLVKVFGPFPNDFAKKNAATIIMIKSLFAEYDSLYAPQIADQKKISFLRTIYK